MHPIVSELIATYRETVQPKMCGLPMYNAALRIEAVGFALRDGRLSGVLLTPWCMNLVLLPDESDAWHKLPPGKTVAVEFPSGNHSCLLSAVEGVVPHLSLPLFTTVQDFADQDTARRVALEALRLLYLDATDKQSAGAGDASQGGHKSGRTMSRRDLLSL
jgi:[NiFe] hydrogenase assembly HybE family chaperone